MKIYIFIIGLGLALTSTITTACDVEQKSFFTFGLQEGFSGVCSNNNSPIKCSGEKGSNEITCSGSEGQLNGYNLQNLIVSACGCTSTESKPLETE